ncbi:MAG: type IV pilus secretin PilQ [Polyangiaceae bacterium]
MRLKSPSNHHTKTPQGASARFMHQLVRVSGLCALGATLLLASPDASAAGLKHATSVRVTGSKAKGEAQVVVAFDREPTYSARLSSGGKRLIVDIPGADVRGAPGALTQRHGVVGGVMTQSFGKGQDKVVRVLVTLLEEAKYSVRVEGKRLVMSFAPGKSGVLERAPAERETRKATPELAQVRDIRFRHESLRDEVVIRVSGDAEFQQSSSKGGKSTLVIKGAKLPDGLQRRLDTSAFNGLVSSVASYASGKDKHTIILEVESDPKAQGNVTRRGDSIVWSFYEPGKLPSSMTGVARDGGAARKSRTLHVDTLTEGLPRIGTDFDELADEDDTAAVEHAEDADQAGAFSPAIAGQERRTAFRGRRIDLDLKDADVHDALRLLADVGRVNVVVADNVSGTVTIRMRNVPWDQAMSVVLQAKSLGMVRQGNMIRVAPLADLEKERDMEIQRRIQMAKLEPLETRLIPVSYAQAGELQARARELLSERGSIAVDERTNVMIVRDVAGNLNQIEELTRSLDTQTPQVLVEARIVEATSRYLRDVGIQWGGDGSFSAATGNPTGLAFPNRVGVVGGASDTDTPTAGLSPFQRNVQNPNFAVNLPATVGTGTGGALGLTFGSIDNTINLAVRLSAAESSGMLRILSSPRILTLDNREARISQGTLIPFSQISAQGVQTTFQEAKLQLLVKPHVTADGSVSMHVKINRDEPDFNQTSPRGDPTILKREAETDLLVMDGHTAVIGGIFTRNTGRNLDQVPFFGDIPLIGLLFQRRRASDTRGELVIFLTPRIVNRAEALGR